MSKFVLTAQLQLQAPTNTQQVINQIRGQLQGAINIPVNVQGSVQAAKQINQVNQAAQKATTAGERMGKAFGASIKRFAAFNIATRAVGLLASKLSQAVDESIKFQRELVKISQVTGKTTRELQGLTDTITNLSTTLGVSSTSLLQTGRILAQAGIQAGDLKVALEALAKTTLAPTFDDITETAEGAVAILAQFGEGVGALEKQLGAINAVAGKFAVESADLISVVRRTGGVFRQAGGDLNELLALFTSVRATTRENAESIATGLRTIFTRIQRPQTIEYLKQFGVQLTDLNGRFVGPYEAVRQLSAALAGLEQGDIRFVQIAEELGGFRQIGKVIPLIQKFEVAERARQAAIAGGNSLTKDAETAQEALAVQIEKTREKFLALIRSISETSTFQIMVKSLLGIANAFIKVAESIKPLLPLIAAFAAVKFTRGLGTFVSGIGAGLRGKNQGGKIHAFASGGFVPGTGNRDTVPAMLTPGEFVIRKSSVNKIGTGTLTAMNAKGYKDGGLVQINPNASGKAIQVIVNERSNVADASAIPPISINLPQGRNSPAKRFSPQELKIAGIDKLGFSAPLTVSGFNDSNFEKAKLSIQDTINNTIDSLSEQAKAIGGSGINLKKTKEKIKKSFRTGIGRIFEEYITDLARIDSPGSRNFDILPVTDPAKKNKIGGLSTIEAYNPSNYGEIKLQESVGQFQDIIKKAANQGFFNEAIKKRIPRKRSGDGEQKAAAPKTNKALGGKIHQFATGGFVPGTGNRDTVPAMLTPGEFVIRKSSVNKIGVDNLAAMNVKGYNGGGYISALSDAGRPTSQFKRYLQDVRGFSRSEARSDKIAASVAKEYKQDFEKWQDAQKKAKADEIKRKEVSQADALKQEFPGGVFKTIPGRIGAFYLNPAQGKDDAFASKSRREFKLNGKNAVLLSGSQASGFSPGKRDLEKSSALAGMVRTNVQSAIDSGLRSIVPNFANTLDVGPIDVQSTQFEESIHRASTDKNIVSTTSGFMFEGIIDAITGAAIKGGRANFDFNRSSIKAGESKLNQMFGSDAVGALYAADAKFSAARRTDVFKKAVNSIKNGNGNLIGTAIQQFADGGIADFKPSLTVRSRGGYGDVGRKKQYLAQMVDYLKQNVDSLTPEMQQQLKSMIARQKSMQSSRTQRFSKRLGFATGGSVSDTVPAMLTPGEFVVNKKAAQSIGYGNLNRMNKQGVVGYAKGGVVDSVGLMMNKARGYAIEGMHKQGVAEGADKVIKKLIKAYEKEMADLDKKSKANKEGIKGLEEINKARRELSSQLVINATAAKQGKYTPPTTTATSTGSSDASAKNKNKNKNTGDAMGKVYALSIAAGAATSYLNDLAGGAEGAATFFGQLSSTLSTLINTSIALSFAFQGLISDTTKQRLAGFLSSTGGFGKFATMIGMTATGLGTLLISVGAVTLAVYSFYNSLIEAEKQNKERAIKEGDAQAAGAAQKEIMDLERRKTFGTVGTAVGGAVGAKYGAASGAAIGSVVPVVGTAIGAVVGAVVGGLTGYFLSDSFAKAVEPDLTPLQEAAISGARAQAYASKATIELGKAAEGVKPQLEDLKSGKTGVADIGSVFSQFDTGAMSVKNSIEEQKKKRASLSEVKTQELNRTGFQTKPTEWIYGSIEDNVKALNADIDASREEEKKIREDFNKQIEETYKSTSGAAASAGLSFDEYISQIEKAAPETAAVIKSNTVQFEKSRKEYENMQKAMQENRAALAAMTYGLDQFSGKASAIANSMSQTADRFGANGFTSAINTLSLAFTNAAASMDPRDITSGLNEFDSQLAAFGASVKDRAKFRGGATGISFLQSRGQNIFNRARAIQSQGGKNAILGGETGVKAYIEAAEQEIKNSGLAPAIKDQLLLQLRSDEITQGLEKALESGDPQQISDALSGPLKQNLEKSLKEFGEAAAKVQQQLRSAYESQIQAQKDYTNALRENIKVQQEAFGLIEEFGGPKFTNQEKIGLLNQDLSAVAGVPIRSGNAQELSRLSNAALTSTQNIQMTQDRNLRRTGVASFGQTTKQTVIDQAQLEKDKAVQKEIIDSARERVKLIKEEIEIAKKKNALEKSSYEKLIGGDVLGFIEGQQAKIVQDALLRGDVATAQQLGPQVTKQAFQNIQEFGTAQEKKLAGQTAARASGLSPAQAAQAGMVLADETPEVQGLQSQAREFAEVMMQASQALTEMEKGELFITATTVNITERKAGQAAQTPVQTGAATMNFSKGGIIYANRGIFVPRGTDTVPAMLTPGEFVVNRAAVQRGNNLAILHAMNNGQQASGPAMARGGTVRYYHDGDHVSGGGMGISTEVANKMSSSLSEFAKAVDKLLDFKLTVKLDPTLVTVNLAGTSFLGKMKDDIKKELFAVIGNKMNNMSFTLAGDPNFNEGMS